MMFGVWYNSNKMSINFVCLLLAVLSVQDADAHEGRKGYRQIHMEVFTPPKGGGTFTPLKIGFSDSDSPESYSLPTPTSPEADGDSPEQVTVELQSFSQNELEAYLQVFYSEKEKVPTSKTRGKSKAPSKTSYSMADMISFASRISQEQVARDKDNFNAIAGSVEESNAYLQAARHQIETFQTKFDEQDSENRSLSTMVQNLKSEMSALTQNDNTVEELIIQIEGLEKKVEDRNREIATHNEYSRKFNIFLESHLRKIENPQISDEIQKAKDEEIQRAKDEEIQRAKDEEIAALHSRISELTQANTALAQRMSRLIDENAQCQRYKSTYKQLQAVYAGLIKTEKWGHI